MIEEAINRLVALAQAAHEKTLTITSLPGRHDGAYVFVDADGKIVGDKTHVPPPRPHCELLANTMELRDYIREAAPRVNASASSPAAPNAVVFVSYTEAELVLDREVRRDRARCPLVFSEPMLWLRQASEKWYSQKDMIRILRIVFRGCLQTSTLPAILKEIKWASGDSGIASVQQGRESMGRSITQEVLGTGAIPEELQLMIRPWENHNFGKSIECAFEVDAESRTFRITPYPSELRKLLDEGVVNVKALLAGDEDHPMPPVYFGDVDGGEVCNPLKR